MVCHGFEIGESFPVDERPALGIMIVQSRCHGCGCLTRLPIVVETDITVTEIAQGDECARVIVTFVVDHAIHGVFQ